MSYIELGNDYTCDICGRKHHSLTGRPSDWSRVQLMRVLRGMYDYDTGMLTLDACPECWPIVAPEKQKTLLSKLMGMFK